MTAAKSIELFVPGRVCLLGEHSDWQAGYIHTVDISSGASPASPHIKPGRCLVYATDCGLHATARLLQLATNGPLLRFISSVADKSDDSGGSRLSLEVPLEPVALDAEAKKGGFFSYVCGTASIILEKYAAKPVAGDSVVEIDNHETSLPVQKGLSSSAAVCVLVAKAFNELFSLGLSVDDIMDAAFLGEKRTPSQCGRMDQCVAYGPGCVSMRIEGETVTATPVPLPPGAEFFFVVADLNAGKCTQTILRELNAAFPVPQNDIHEAVQMFLGPINQELVADAERLIRLGDAQGLGVALTNAQRLFDKHLQPACPSQLAAPKLHRLLDDKKIHELTFGGKGVGSQGDGSVQFVAKSREAQQQLCALLSSEQYDCHPFSFTLSGP